MIEDRVRAGVAAAALAVLLGGCAQPGTSGTVEAGDGVSDTVPVWSAPPSGPAGPAGPASPVPTETAVTCPPDGVRVAAGTGDAASGLRVLGITLTNCGTKVYRVNGYPSLRALDQDHQVLDVTMLNGAKQVLHTDLPWDGPPKPVVLKPGQQAGVGIAWRNTYDDLTDPPVTVTYLEVTPSAGGPAQVIAPPSGLDLGSTGRIAVSAWQLDADPTGER
ncbi:DUF4232 domain-containing protein [Actinoplanes sp. L3-i22]|uniref:DUF4232 domain-containing protein n=1 Tax=Actinoplanes sp. L3-i22 TaxID=2836373 RepID=UPI001C74FD77|nr:DUF4232 domain-containing protein [Actinoplanes sp. L3-i22]BCY07132.1 hypothetical protein L3i22_022200 [Actinoplanes sp. L3-i22]